VIVTKIDLDILTDLLSPVKAIGLYGSGPRSRMNGSTDFIQARILEFLHRRSVSAEYERSNLKKGRHMGHKMAIFSKTPLTTDLIQYFMETITLNKTARANIGVRTRGTNAKCPFCRNRLYRSDAFHCCSVLSNQQWPPEQQLISFPK
jgi:hypothetical protein